MLEVVGKPGVDGVLFIGPSQGGGKSELHLCVINHFIGVDPSPMIFVTYSVDMARRFSRHRVAKMIRETELLRGKVREAKSRDSGNTVLDKEFDGGELTLVGANSAGGLAMYPKRVALFDEIGRYPASAGIEGDPISLAVMRTTAFLNAVKFYATSPSVREVCASWPIWNESDQAEYHVVCVDCERAQIPKWSQVHWDKDEAGEYVDGSEHYVCEHCGSVWRDKERWAASRHGHYVASKPFRGVHGFRMNGLAVIGRTLRSIVKQWLAARGQPNKLQVFINTVLCEWWDETHYAKTVDETGLLPRRELMQERGDRPVIPAGVALLTAGVDVQDNRFEISVYGWGLGEESWLLKHQVIYGDPTTKAGDVLSAAWLALDAWLLAPWPRERGGADFIRGTAVDTGGHHTQATYDFCASRYRRSTPDGGNAFVFAIKGAPGAGEIWPRSHSTTVTKVPLYRIRVDAGKQQIYGRLAIAEPGPGYIHLPDSVDAEFLKSLTAEQCKQTTDRRGFPRFEWVLKAGRVRNEGLDCAVYAYAALHGLRVNGFDLEAESKDLGARPVWEPPEMSRVAAEQRQVEPERDQVASSWVGDTSGWLRRR